MEIRVLFGLIYIISTLTITNNFPNRSKCAYSVYRKEMNCANENLDDIPYELIKNAYFKSLYMELNNLRVLNTRGFDQVDYKKSIKKLILHSNQIELIQPNSFCELPNLETLDLSFNNLKHIFNEFHSSKRLINLNLEGNPIQNISEDAFRNLEDLRLLILKNCKISWLPINFLRGSKITKLDLSGNIIKNFDEVYLPPSLVTLIGPEKYISNNGNMIDEEAEKGDEEDAKGLGNFMKVNYFIVIFSAIFLIVVL